MTDDRGQEQLPIPEEHILEFDTPLYYEYQKSDFGILSKLALEADNWTFKATHKEDELYEMVNEAGVSFLAELREGKGKNKGTYQVKGSVNNVNQENVDYLNQVKINGVGQAGEKLRPAQIGAVYSLMSHWSLSNDVATIVLPTGTGKTETMLVATLADRATKTLVVVPTIDLKNQIAEKFSNWGILRQLGVIPLDCPNPKVLVLNKILSDVSCVETIEKADVVISTTAFIARANQAIKNELQSLFSHVYFDEAHHVAASEWDLIKGMFGASKIVQFTATPYRNDRKPIEGKVVYNYPLSQALKDKCFSKISLVTVDERHPRKKDKAIADAAMDRLLEDREKGFSRHKMMVRAENRSHAAELFKSYKEWFPDEKIVLVYTGIKGRKTIIEDIKRSKYDIVVCVDMLKEGFDSRF